MAKDKVFALSEIHLTAHDGPTHLGIVQDPGHAEPWIIAMPAKPGFLTTMDYSARWAIEPMFSDFKSWEFDLEDSQISYPDRLSRLVLVIALALYVAVSMGQWDATVNPSPAEKTLRSTTTKTRTLSNLPLHQRLALHRQAHRDRHTHSSFVDKKPLSTTKTDGW
ncbi:hypothetical protein ACQVP2_25795 [Methylobacterium aquaticum]|uniref:hypothetical protein n=1 Tax=Methylobacterium aquaticum TaxID=270351 RepID=UPI003D1689F7